MNYTPINWQNGEYGNTPLNADNLNHMDNAIKTIAEESNANAEGIEYCQEDIEANAGKIEENTELISGLRTDVTELQNKISGDITPHSVNTPALTAAEGNFTNVTVSGEAVIPTIKGNNAAVSMPNGISTTDVAANKTESRTVESVFLNTTNLTATGYVELVGPTIKRGRYDDMPCIYGEDTRKINFPNGIEVGGELNVNNFTANESVIDELRVDAIRTSYNPQKRTLEIEPKIIANDIDCTNIKAVGYLECGIIESAGIHSTEEIIDGHGNVLSEVAANARDNTAISLTTDFSKVTDSAERLIVGIDALGQSEQAKSIVIPTVQGQVANTSSAINQALTTSDIRCSSDVMWLAKGTVISVPSAFEIYALYASTATGNITNKIQWASTQTLDADGYWRLMVRRTNGYALAPDSFVMEIAAPTPTNPVPIVDASGEIEAHTKNLFDTTATTETKSGITATKKADGSISLSGTATANTTLFATTFELKKGTYTFSGANNGSASSYYIQIADNPITKELAQVSTPKTLTFSEDTSITFRIRVVSGATVNTIIYPQIEEGTTATDYVPYASNSISIPFPMRSIGDIHDELIIREDRTGKYIQRIGVDDLGTRDYTYTASWGGHHAFTTEFGSNIKPIASNDTYGNLLCSKFRVSTRNIMASASAEGLMCLNTFGSVIFATDTVSSVEAFKSAMLGTKLYYELPNPIITDLTAEQVDSILSLHTYKPTTVFETEMGGSVSYAGDVKAYVDNKFNYSYTDRIIGKWADGKDLHQMVIQTITPRAINTDTVVSNLITKNNASVKNISGIVETGNYQIQINMYYSGSYNIATFININGIVMRTPAEAYANCPCEIIVEYTLK